MKFRQNLKFKKLKENAANPVKFLNFYQELLLGIFV